MSTAQATGARGSFPYAGAGVDGLGTAHGLPYPEAVPSAEPGMVRALWVANLCGTGKRREGAEHVADIEAARKAFKRYDLNGDGLISAAEYKSVMAQLGDPYVTEPIAQAVINSHDGNGDGLLSFDEFWASQNKNG